MPENRFLFVFNCKLLVVFLLLFVNIWFIFVFKHQPTRYMCRIFINTSDIALLEGLSVPRASVIKTTIMDALQKKKPEKLTIDEYCEYRGVPKDLVENKLKK